MEKIKPSLLIGVTGLPGAGKSFFSTYLHSLFKAGTSRLIDADKLGHSIYKIEEVKDFIKQYCAACFDVHGEIDRKSLAEKVFSNSEDYQIFNNFISFYIKQELFHKIDTSQEKVLIVDAALIFEWKTENCYNEIVLVDVPENKRQEHLEKRGDDFQKYKLREKFFISLQKKKDSGVYIVNNDYSELAIQKECKKFKEYLENKYGKLV